MVAVLDSLQKTPLGGVRGGRVNNTWLHTLSLYEVGLLGHGQKGTRCARRRQDLFLKNRQNTGARAHAPILAHVVPGGAR